MFDNNSLWLIVSLQDLRREINSKLEKLALNFGQIQRKHHIWVEFVQRC